VRGLKRQHINQLFPGYSGHWQTITLLPPLARRLSLLTPWLYPILATLPPLRTHYLALLHPPTKA
jgi:hypothetical protein